MLTTIGYTLLGGLLCYQGYYAFESIFLKERYQKRKMIMDLFKCFEVSNLYRKVGKKKEYPCLLNVKVHKSKTTFVFTIPKGMDPNEFNNKLYVFKQFFGQYIDMAIKHSRIVLNAYTNGLPNEFSYNFDEIHTKHQLPIICGRNLEDKLYIYDMVEHPHLLIAGETGSGKSSQIRSILTTLIRHKRSSELKLVLGDLKRSEFHLFKHVSHVKGVYHSADELRPILTEIKHEMTKRGNMLDDSGVNSIGELKKKLPYIIVCIDEVALLKKEQDIMDILEEISSIGRSLGVFIILSMQRPDSKILDGKLKVNLTVRMGFQTADSINSNIIGTPGAEKIEIPGRMIMKINSKLQEIQCPWLNNNKARMLLELYKQEEVITNHVLDLEQEDYNKVLELLQNE